MADGEEEGGGGDGVEELQLPAELSSHYRTCCKLGEGAYGVVYKSWLLRHGRRRRSRRVALKRCVGVLDPGDPVTVQRTYREVTVLRQLCHDHVPALLDVRLPLAGSCDLFLALGLGGRDLARALREGLPPEAAATGRVACHVLRALKYLHCAELVHRDVKPSNILVQRDWSAQLCDFGFVRFVGPYPRALTEYVGMRWYRAPELLLGSRRYSSGVDIWATGCVVAEMALGRPLLPGISVEEQLSLIVGLVLGASPDEDQADIEGGVEREAVARFMATRPAGGRLEQRLGEVAAPVVLDFVRCTLRLPPADRPSARALLTGHPLFKGLRRSEDDVHWREFVSLALRDDTLHRPEDYVKAIADEAAILREQQRAEGWGSGTERSSGSSSSSSSSSASSDDGRDDGGGGGGSGDGTDRDDDDGGDGLR